MNKPPSLEETQKLVWKLITAPEGVAKALEKDASVELPIAGDHRLSATERLDIYANMYFYRIRDSLKNDFPRVLSIIGEDCFHNLITDYLLAHPSTHWTLRDAGKDLPRLLESHLLTRQWPYLAELAQLEWEMVETFDAPDAVPLTLADLSPLPQDAWGGLTFSFVPSYRRRTFTFRMDAMMHELRNGDVPKEIQQSPCDMILWRKQFEVFFAALEPLETTLVKRLEQGANIAELCEIAAESLPPETAVTTVSAMLQGWMERELLAATR